MGITDYVIYRKGSNRANQPMNFNWVPVCVVEAISKDKAIKIALEDGLTCYGNQVLRAVPESKVPKLDWELAVTESEISDLNK